MVEELPCLKNLQIIFWGTGFDIHAFEDNKEMFLGGVKTSL